MLVSEVFVIHDKKSAKVLRSKLRAYLLAPFVGPFWALMALVPDRDVHSNKRDDATSCFRHLFSRNVFFGSCESASHPEG